MHNTTLRIPVLDLQDYIGYTFENCFVRDLEKALSTTGFFFLKNHGIPESRIRASEQTARQFFNLPTHFRARYEKANLHHQVGYTPLRTEKGEFAQNTPDEKHFFQIGDRSDVPYVTEVPYFNKTATELYYDFSLLYLRLMEAVALSLNLPRTYFRHKVGNSIIRLIDYPPTADPLLDDGKATLGGNAIGMCASKHTDINFLTLLLAREEGLQLFWNNVWTPITISDPDLLIVNCGDMLQHLTGGKYVSGLHRVVCQKNVRRYSVPFFGHIKEDESIVPLVPFYKKWYFRATGKYQFKTAGEFLHHRLQQIGLV